MSEKGFRVEIPVSFNRRLSKPSQQVSSDKESDGVPRIARLLALAHKWETMIRHGEVHGYAAISRRTGLSRARVLQLCRLAMLAPCLQEAILSSGQRARGSKHQVHAAAEMSRWEEQQELCPCLTSVLR